MDNTKKWNIGIVLAAIMVIFTYIYSLGHYRIQSVYTNDFATYCINTLILFDFLVIRNARKRIIDRKVEKINKIDDLEKKELEENCYLDSIKFIHQTGGADFLKYDLIDNKRKLRKLALFNIAILILGFIPVLFTPIEYNAVMIFVIQIMVGFANIIYLYIWEIEQGKTRLFVQKLTQSTYKKAEQKINEFYEKNVTLIMHREEILSVGNQPYYVVIYSKENKRYRILLNSVVAFVFVTILVIAYMNGNIILNLSSENNIFLNIYPNLILLLFCYYSNDSFKNRISEHEVYIEEGTKENILASGEKEYKSIYYECTENRKTKLYKLTVIEKSHMDSMWFRIKKFFNRR